MSTSFIQTMDDTAKALVFTKFGSFLGLGTDQNLGLVFAPKEVAQRKIAEKRGNDSVEFISLWRDAPGYDWARNNTAIARKGVDLIYETSEKRSIISAKAVPALINYNIYFWSRDFDKLAKITESYLLWQHNSPQLILNYLNTYPMDMYLRFGQPVDETNYNIYEKGLYFVYRMPLTLDGWILETFTTDTILTIILDIFLRQGTAPNYLDTLVAEFIITAES